LLGIALLCSLILALAPSGAAAQSHAAPSDPEADSPSGAVYELPLDRARKDAAPRRGGRGSSGGGSSGQGSGGDPAQSDTSIRSENNFGSSSQVPGVSDGEGSNGDDGGSGAGSGGSGGSGSGGNGSGGDGSGGTGSDDPLAKSRAEELASRATGNPIGTGGGPSNGVVIPLVAGLLLVGAAIGIVAGRRSRTLRRRGT
jgi:hypothetical protein